MKSDLWGDFELQTGIEKTNNWILEVEEEISNVILMKEKGDHVHNEHPPDAEFELNPQNASFTTQIEDHNISSFDTIDVTDNTINANDISRVEDSMISYGYEADIVNEENNVTQTIPLEMESISVSDKREGWIWEPRDNPISTDSEIISHKAQTSEELIDRMGCDINDKFGSQLTVVNDLKSLRIKSNRGRPRKIPPKKIINSLRSLLVENGLIKVVS